MNAGFSEDDPEPPADRETVRQLRNCVVHLYRGEDTRCDGYQKLAEIAESMRKFGELPQEEQFAAFDAVCRHVIERAEKK